MHFRAQQYSMVASFGTENGVFGPFPVLESLWGDRNRASVESPLSYQEGP
jgi:hypothetical protein